MPADERLTTRKEFLLAMGGVSLLAAQESTPTATPASARSKVLIVVAHPDDEYAFAATIYRLVRESGWTADQVIITNGEAGYRYSALAETYYGVTLAREPDGRDHLPAIRKEEVTRAGKVLGIRHHYFLDQKDLGFTVNAASADASNWDGPRLLSGLHDLLLRERYDVVFTLLPTAQTHGHHRAATLLALQAVAELPEERRPLVFGAEPQSRTETPLQFAGLSDLPLTATTRATPVLTVDRTRPVGATAVNYQAVVNWVIAEHKSQGLFQMDAGRHQLEPFWLFAISGRDAEQRAEKFAAQLRAPLQSTAAAH